MHETKENLAERIAVFRHALIARLLPKELTLKQRQREIRRIVATEHQIPGSTRTRVAESTLRDWLRDYRAGGFEALKPKQRIDAGHPRALAPELVERLLQLKESDPDRSIRLVINEARAQGVIGADEQVPISTVYRLFKRHGLMAATIGGASPISTRDSCG